MDINNEHCHFWKCRRAQFFFFGAQSVCGGVCMVLWQVKVKVNLVLSAPWSHVVLLEVQLLAFLTCVLDGSEWSTSCPGGQLPAPAALSPVPIEFEAGWTSKLVWTFWRILPAIEPQLLYKAEFLSVNTGFTFAFFFTLLSRWGFF
jgi:hypothetical protein